MKLNSLLKIYLFSLVILYEHLDTEAGSQVYGSFCTFYLHGALLQWLANTFLTTEQQKGLICASQCKRALEQNLFSITVSNS